MTTTMTTTTTTTSRTGNSSSCLPIHAPIGNHGDVLLDMQVRYTNDRELRRRVGDDIHTTKRSVGRDKEEAIRKQHVDSFMQATAAAARSGSPQAAVKALEELVVVHQHNNPFSLAGDFASCALWLLREPHRRAEAERELQQRRTQKRSCLALGIVCVVVGMGFVVFHHDSMRSLRFVFWIVALFMLAFVPISLLKREQETKRLVDELYLIASSR